MKRVWAALAAVAMLAALGATSGGPAVAANSCDQAPSASDANGKNVAIVIHGWNGTAMKDTRDALQRTLGDRWVVSIYDYPELAGQWPDSSSVVAECLRKTIRSAHTATGSSNANVYIVAHSMGGLLARFALNPAKDPAIGNLIGGVVTLDTPHHGSPLGATGWASIGQYFKNTSGNAGRCLAIHHPGTLPYGCEAPPWLPAGVPLSEIAGDTSITRNFFMFGYYGVNTNSDGAVWMNSQTGYSTSADGTAPTGTVATATVSCEYESGAIAAAGAAAGSIFSLFSSSPQEFAAGLPSIADRPSEVGIGLDITNNSPCGHGKMPTNGEAIGRVTTALKGMPPRVPSDVIRAQLQTITAPPMCTRPAGKLVNGSLPVADPLHNGATVLVMDSSQHVMFAQSTASGAPALAVDFDCSAGGVDWPNVIGFYDAGLNLLGYQDLGDIDHREHSAVTSMQFNGSALHVTWDTFEGAGFGVCDPNQPDHEAGDFTFDNGTGKATLSNFTTSCPQGG